MDEKEIFSTKKNVGTIHHSPDMTVLVMHSLFPYYSRPTDKEILEIIVEVLKAQIAEMSTNIE